MPPKSSRRTAISVRKSAACSISSSSSSWASMDGAASAGEPDPWNGYASASWASDIWASIMRESSPVCPTWNSWQWSIPGPNRRKPSPTSSAMAQTIADKFGTRAVSDYHQLLDRIDAVSIAVPTLLHREVAGTFLSRGIPTLVEKPLASTLAEAELLVSLSHSTGALLQVGHVERFNPALSALHQMAIRPKYISAERLSTYTFRSTDIGVVLDLMIHDIDLVLSLFHSPVRSVSAVGVSLFGEHEDVANARVEFENGTVANLTASRASYTALRKMRIWSTEGYASLDFAAKSATLVQP